MEESSELLRKRLQRRPNYNPHTAYAHLDRRENGYLTVDEFRTFLIENKVAVSDCDLKLLVTKYDTNRDGRVSYSEFLAETTPKQI